MRYPAIILALLLTPGFVAVAAAPADLPPPPTDSLNGEVPEPEIRIINRDKDTVEEYRVGGALYMIKITPKRGVAYYLVDTDGDGNLETQRSALEPRMAIPGWVILRWK